MCPVVLALLLALMHQVAAQNLNITEHVIDDQTIPICSSCVAHHAFFYHLHSDFWFTCSNVYYQYIDTENGVVVDSTSAYLVRIMYLSSFQHKSHLFPCFYRSQRPFSWLPVAKDV